MTSSAWRSLENAWCSLLWLVVRNLNVSDQEGRNLEAYFCFLGPVSSVFSSKAGGAHRLFDMVGGFIWVWFRSPHTTAQILQSAACWQKWLLHYMLYAIVLSFHEQQKMVLKPQQCLSQLFLERCIYCPTKSPCDRPAYSITPKEIRL